MSSIRKFFKTRKRNKLIALVVALLVVGIGYTLVLTKAAGFFASVTPSSASLAGNASLVNESDGTKAIQFNAPAPNPDPGTGVKKNCIVKPSACGYPDATNTGYKHLGLTKDDLTTTGVTIDHEGNFIVTQDGTTIDKKHIKGCVIIRAKNVTIKRSLISDCRGVYLIWLHEKMSHEGGGVRDTSNFLMEDVEVDGVNHDINAAMVDDNGKGAVVRRMYMHHVSEGPHPGSNWLIEDSYIGQDMYVCPPANAAAEGCHTDSIQTAGGSNITLRHNTIWNNPANVCLPPPNEDKCGGKNAVVRIATEQGSTDGYVIENNLLDGGNYAVQVRSQGSGAPKNVRVTNNRIVPSWRFAPYDFTGINVFLSGNVRDDNNEPLNTPM